MTEKINRYSNYVFKIFLLLIIIFISSDIFLTIDISGATIRFSYILFFFLFILWIIYLCLTKNFSIPLDKAFLPLLLFCFISFISSLNSGFPVKSLIYSLWTAFSALIILFLIWFAQSNKLDNLDWLLKIYFYSYFVISIFGIYQLLLPFIIGEKTPLVMQWWHTYNLARINGLSFEPSFFATYMLMGCFIWFILWIRKNELVKYKSIIFITIAFVVVLSSSRIGWIGVALILAYGLIEFLGHYSIKKKFTAQYLKYFISFLVVALFLVIAILIMVNNKERFQFIFQGTGLFDTSDSSYSLRFARALQTFQVFIDKPLNSILGVGPGGVGAYLFNNPEKFQIFAPNFEELWETEPLNVTAELLASVGIVGFIIFSWFIVGIFKRLWVLYKNNNLLQKYRTICLALFWGLVIELIILQFNQNYLRPYLWLHIGISIATANSLEHLIKSKDTTLYVLDKQV